MLNNFLGDFKRVVENISIFLIEERHNYLQAFEKDKTRFLVCMEKKLALLGLKKYVTSYAILQILHHVNILKKYQLKGKALPCCTNSFKRSIGLLFAHTFEQRVLENRGLLLHDLVSDWLFYRAWPSRDTEINNPI